MPPTVFSLHGAGEMHGAVALVPWSTAPPTGLLAVEDLDSLKPEGRSPQFGQPDAGGMSVDHEDAQPRPPAIHSQHLSSAVSAASVAHRSASRSQLRPTAGLARRLHVVITRAGHEPVVVIISLADFESLRETAYLLRSPANARRLLDAVQRLESVAGERHDLVDDQE